ncbi:glycoside hydrolase family 15 protein [Streptomyces lonarensis]|uniref:Glycoside hydrolase family 15 protein n=1 Tax=Streptomyces lonarensis TaxID=700599 RepID=A0A7X6CXR0_9ACTN|nr:glycoside hydrolase family 15 protein [Streptomyces lonarensis]NJQ04358.1 glycoside hydrolase family 15 protein [Streptomyces lonarensis]
MTPAPPPTSDSDSPASGGHRPGEPRPPRRPADDYPPIGDYAFLSDCHTSALLGPDGTVEWMCAPRFDSPSTFGRMLDRAAGGWELTVAGAGPPERRYVDDSLVLETRWEAPHATVVAHDFLALRPAGHGDDEADITPEHVLVRLVRCVEGTASITLRVEARPDYARATVRWRETDHGLATGHGTDDGSVWLTGAPRPAATGDEQQEAVTRVELTAGAAAVQALGYRGGPARPLDVATAEQLRDATVSAWQSWSDRSTYDGVGAAQVRRSALVLRGLLADETGVLLAAPTTSLPEWIGGARNWDYRYVWHRDASLGVLVLLRLGHSEEAGRYLRFLLGRCLVHHDRLDPMLTVDGTTEIAEAELDHLEGYAASRPVRVGNEAHQQHQIDAYGHIVDAAHAFHQATGSLSDTEVEEVGRLVDVVAKRWREKDHGLWEARDSPRHWTHSKLCSWVALDRGVLLAERAGAGREPAVARWRRERDEVAAELLREGYDEGVGSFVQSYGATHTDASLLHVPLFGFLAGDDPRVLSTLDRVEAELGIGGALLRRYDPEATDDGLDDPEGAFLMSSFDMVSALVLAGRREEAEERFAALCSHVGPLGLLPEQMDRAGTFLGNYPQAFTHLALIEAAMNLDGAEQGEALHTWAARQRGDG